MTTLTIAAMLVCKFMTFESDGGWTNTVSFTECRAFTTKVDRGNICIPLLQVR